MSIDRKIDVTAMNFYWFRIDNKHMTEPGLDQALMESTYNLQVPRGVKENSGKGK